jgi:hypothetical protein
MTARETRTYSKSKGELTVPTFRRTSNRCLLAMVVDAMSVMVT